jgi:hypothetical protein
MKREKTFQLSDDGELLQDLGYTGAASNNRKMKNTVTDASQRPVQPIISDLHDTLPIPVTCRYCSTQNPAGGTLQCVKCGGWLVELEHIRISSSDDDLALARLGRSFRQLQEAAVGKVLSAETICTRCGTVNPIGGAVLCLRCAAWIAPFEPNSIRSTKKSQGSAAIPQWVLKWYVTDRQTAILLLIPLLSFVVSGLSIILFSIGLKVLLLPILIAFVSLLIWVLRTRSR